jgi:adenylosuccinate synthase
MPCSIIVGGQWGDEAKGKIASYLAFKDNVTIAARAGLGPGAGHTVCYEGRTYRFRQIPAAAVKPDTRLLLGAGVLINPEVLLDEINQYKLHDRIGIDYRATVIEPKHVAQEKENQHLQTVVKSTGSGHGPALAERALRSALRVEQISSLKRFVTDVSEELNLACDQDEQVQVEGTNGFLLSVLYGTYPHTVAKDSTASTVAADVGLGPRRITDVVLVFKAFPTRVGGGDFPTEIPEEEAARRGFLEFGTVTGRRRRVGEFDFSLARQAVRVNCPSILALTFLDRLDPDCSGAGNLRREAADFIENVEHHLGMKVDILGTGPDTFDVIDRRSLLDQLPQAIHGTSGGRR